MLPKNNRLLTTILLFVIGAGLVVAILILLNQAGKPGNAKVTKTESSPEAKIIYPAPLIITNERIVKGQDAYPPPSTEVVHPTQTPIAPEAIISPPAGYSLITPESVQRTSLVEAKTALDGKKAIFLDVRSAESYARNHVPGAISIPETQIVERLIELDPNLWIITYCS